MFRFPIRTVVSALNRKLYSVTPRKSPGLIWKPAAFTAVVRVCSEDDRLKL